MFYTVLANVCLSMFSNYVFYRQSYSSIFGKNGQKRLYLRTNVEIKKGNNFVLPIYGDTRRENWSIQTWIFGSVPKMKMESYLAPFSDPTT